MSAIKERRSVVRITRFDVQIGGAESGNAGGVFRACVDLGFDIIDPHGRAPLPEISAPFLKALAEAIEKTARDHAAPVAPREGAPEGER